MDGIYVVLVYFLLGQCEQGVEYYVVGLVVYWYWCDVYFIFWCMQYEVVFGSGFGVCMVVVELQVGCLCGCFQCCFQGSGQVNDFQY